MKVLVVVLNYRTPQLAVRCLESLEREVGQIEGGMRVVVPDNASGDDSVEVISAGIRDHGWGAWASVLPLEKNGGYCFGNNAAIRQELGGDDPPDFVMLVNPDTYVRDGGVRRLLDFMETRPRVGIVGARLEDPDGVAQNGAFRFPSIFTEIIGGFRLGLLSKALKEHDLRYTLGDEPMPVDWVVGAAMMIRREVFDQIGLLDEGYFLYFDEVDFCYRAAQAGWERWYVPSSVVVHLVGQSTGISDTRKKPPRYPDYWFESRRRYFVKNYGRLQATAADVAYLIGYSTFRVRRRLQKKPDLDPPHFMWDFFRNSTVVKGYEL
ncbi:MAG: glycosyltransferase family 2 protein [Myxococcota bacterium]